MIEAKIVLDSAHPQGDRYRLTTFLLRYPKFVHAEHCRHRSMSLCVSSSRAVPVSKNLEEVRSDELRAAPVWWGKEQRGMSAAEELDDNKIIHDSLDGLQTSRGYAKSKWKQAAQFAVIFAEGLMAEGVHKSIVNRVLEPFLHVNVLCTVTTPGLMNFFGLRLDKAAQPEIRTLAEAMWKAYEESAPGLLCPGEWHLPFIENADWERCPDDLGSSVDDVTNAILKVSTARCARLSYTSFETGRRSTIEEDLKLYDRLITSKPIHASPAEHQATPDEMQKSLITKQSLGVWEHPEQHGNLPGWIQHRKLLPGEAVAELPEAYR